MKNFIQDGDSLTLTAPSDTGSVDLSSGDGLLVGGLFGVCVADAAMGETVVIKTTGVFDIAKATSQAWAAGDVIYWDDSAKKCTTTSSGNTKVGVCTAAAGSSATTGYVRLNGHAG